MVRRSILALGACLLVGAANAAPLKLPGAAPKHVTHCSSGTAGGFACSNVDLAANVTLTQLGATAGQEGNDIWGWTDPTTGREYALVGIGNGTSFVDITAPDHPVVLGLLPTHSANSLWRGIKVHGNYAYIVSEAVDHGMQVFDLTRLRNVVSPPVVFTENAHYARFGRAHNIVINTDSGYAYATGSRQGLTTCSGGLHMISLANPLAPQFAGCFSADGYTHDAQCVIYEGPDADYTGRELCFASNEDTLTIVDVTNKAAPVQVARVGYAGSSYTHQGWLAPGQRWFLMDDELDELDDGHNTRTYVWDLQDIDNPQQTFAYTGPVAATDHNLFIRGQYAYLANYKSGLRVLDLAGIAQGQIVEAGFFDTYPPDDATGFDGAWGNFPFFDSGTVIVGDISRGMFVLQPTLCTEPAAATALVANGDGDNRIALSWNASPEPGASYEVYRELGGCGAGPGELLVGGQAGASFVDTTASGAVDYGYRVRVLAGGGQCRSAFSGCVEASTTGQCTAPPLFDGLASATTPGKSRCRVDLAWSAAAPSCAGPASYEIHRSTDPAFLPTSANRIAVSSELAARDVDVQGGQAYHYLVRARDLGNDAAENNEVRLSVTPVGAIGTGAWRNGAEEGEPFLGSGGVVPLHIAWHAVEDQVHSGQRSYGSGYPSSDCVAITTPAIDLGNAGASDLTFFQRYGIEDGFDGGRVELSTDGTNWLPIAPVGGYPQQITGTGNACGWPVGSGVYSGTALAWAQQTVDLGARTGAVYLRWVFSTDTAAAEEGWWIDDIQIAPAQVSGSCSTILPATALSIVSHAPQPSRIGDAITVTFALQATPPEDGVATGEVVITAQDGAEQCSATLPASSCEVTLLAAGPRTLVATYAGDARFPPAVDSQVHDVTRATSALTLDVMPAEATPPGSVQASIALPAVGALPAPTGSVTISSNLEGASCVVTLPASSCSLGLSVGGIHVLSASYSGDGVYETSAASASHVVFTTPALFADGFE
jgi:choice-of-anchor B domain-containing protein